MALLFPVSFNIRRLSFFLYLLKSIKILSNTFGAERRFLLQIQGIRTLRFRI